MDPNPKPGREPSPLPEPAREPTPIRMPKHTWKRKKAA